MLLTKPLPSKPPPGTGITAATTLQNQQYTPSEVRALASRTHRTSVLDATSPEHETWCDCHALKVSGTTTLDFINFVKAVFPPTVKFKEDLTRAHITAYAKAKTSNSASQLRSRAGRADKAAIQLGAQPSFPSTKDASEAAEMVMQHMSTTMGTKLAANRFMLKLCKFGNGYGCYFG